MDWRQLLGSLRFGSPASWMVVATGFAVVLSLGWTWLAYVDTVSGVALVAVLSAGIVGGLAWRTARAPAIASALLSSGGGVALTMVSRETFSIWPAAAALLFLSCLSRDLRVTRMTSGVSLIGVAGAIAWVAVRSPADLVVVALPILVALLALTALTTLRAVSMHVAALRREAAAARHLTAEKDELTRRAALAHELHDTLGHHLTAVVVQSEAGQINDPDAALKAIGALGRDALEELEEVLYGLREATPFRVSDALERIETHLLPNARAAGLATTCTVTTSVCEPAILSTAYRVVQEALTNVVKHANARSVSVEVFDEGNALVARIHDDGTATGPVSTRTGSSGIAGLRARVEGMGGSLDMSPGQEGGLVLTARLPQGDS